VTRRNGRRADKRVSLYSVPAPANCALAAMANVAAPTAAINAARVVFIGFASKDQGCFASGRSSLGTAGQEA
jgi:hypothetical protein